MTDLEYLMMRRELYEYDVESYIDYAINLDKLLAKRMISLKSKHYKSDDDESKGREWRNALRQVTSIWISHIAYIFDRCVRRFQASMALWDRYIAFLTEKDSVSLLNGVFGRALSLHPHEEHLWIKASLHELERNCNSHAARVLLQRSLRVNKSSKTLWRKYFEFEVWNASRIGDRKRALDIMNDNNLILGAPVVVFRHALEAIPEVQFGLEMWQEALKVSKLLAQSLEGLLKTKFGSSSQYWLRRIAVASRADTTTTNEMMDSNLVLNDGNFLKFPLENQSKKSSKKAVCGIDMVSQSISHFQFGKSLYLEAQQALSTSDFDCIRASCLELLWGRLALQFSGLIDYQDVDEMLAPRSNSSEGVESNCVDVQPDLVDAYQWIASQLKVYSAPSLAVSSLQTAMGELSIVLRLIEFQEAVKGSRVFREIKETEEEKSNMRLDWSLWMDSVEAIIPILTQVAQMSLSPSREHMGNLSQQFIRLLYCGWNRLSRQFIDQTMNPSNIATITQINRDSDSNWHRWGSRLRKCLELSFGWIFLSCPSNGKKQSSGLHEQLEENLWNMMESIMMSMLNEDPSGEWSEWMLKGWQQLDHHDGLGRGRLLEWALRYSWSQGSDAWWRCIANLQKIDITVPGLMKVSSLNLSSQFGTWIDNVLLVEEYSLSNSQRKLMIYLQEWKRNFC